jgi:hypothetical protein
MGGPRPATLYGSGRLGVPDPAVRVQAAAEGDVEVEVAELPT